MKSPFVLLLIATTTRPVSSLALSKKHHLQLFAAHPRRGSSRHQHAAPPRYCSSTIILQSSSDTYHHDGCEQETLAVNSRLAKRYTISSILFACVSVVLATPDRTKPILLSTKYGGAAGYGLAAACCHLLAEATTAAAVVNNNTVTATPQLSLLSNDTSKRLNIGLFFFCLISLASIPGEAAFHPRFVPAMLLFLSMTTLKLVGCNLAYNGWKRGVQESSSSIAVHNDGDALTSSSGSSTRTTGSSITDSRPRGQSGANDATTATITSQQLLQEFVSGIRSTVRGIVGTPRKGIVYLFGLIFVSMGMLSAAMEGKFFMDYHAPLFTISLQWSAVARLFFISTMVNSLKEAAERGELTGTTSIQLNFMIALWALVVAIGQGTYRLSFSATSSPMILMCIPFLYGGIRSLYQKSNNKLESSPSPFLKSGNVGDDADDSEQMDGDDDDDDDYEHSKSQ